MSFRTKVASPSDLTQPRRNLFAAAALAAVIVATGLRLSLGKFGPGLDSFALYYPAILGAALFGGEIPGAVAVGSSLLFGWRLFAEPHGTEAASAAAVALNLLIHLFAGGLVAFAGARLRTLLRRHRENNARLAERELHYRTLFESVSDGFCLVEAVRDAQGAVADYTVLEANPAMLGILRTDERIVGRRQSEVLTRPPADWLQACNAALAGAPVSFTFNSQSDRWYDIHLSRVSDDRLAQFVVDITDQKQAERRQVELFDELNHRVKNNLAMISAVLGMQARASDQPLVREQLLKAVDRIQTIADVHATLYRASSTDEVDFAAYLQDLCGRLSAALLEGRRLRLDLRAEPIRLPLDKAVALGVVVNELVTNAVKHAYPSGEDGVVQVVLRRKGDALTLCVGDSGRGLPAGKPSSGLGMRLVRSLIQQLDGRLEIGAGPGSSFTVRLREPGAATAPSPAQYPLL